MSDCEPWWWTLLKRGTGLVWYVATQVADFME